MDSSNSRGEVAIAAPQQHEQHEQPRLPSVNPRVDRLLEEELERAQAVRDSRALRLITLSWPQWRQKIHILVAQKKYLDYFIFFLIVCNCATISTANTTCFEPHQNAVLILEDIFLFFFISEIVLKLIGLTTRYYFNSWWNVLDFSIVLLSCYGFLHNHFFAKWGYAAEYTAALSFRFIRPLRALSGAPALRTILVALAECARHLKHVLFLALLFMVSMSFIGLEFFRGKLTHRCFDLQTAELKLIPGQLLRGASLQPRAELYDSVCMLSGISDSTRPQGRPPASQFQSLLVMASQGYIVNQSMLPPLPLNFDNEGYVCPYGSYCSPSLALEHGSTSFDNILHALTTLYSLTVTEGWSFVVYYLMDALGWYVSLYMGAIVAFGTIFIFNLTIAVLTDAYARSSMYIKAQRQQARRSAARAESEQRQTTEKEQAQRRSRQEQQQLSAVAFAVAGPNGSTSSSFSSSGVAKEEGKGGFEPEPFSADFCLIDGEDPRMIQSASATVDDDDLGEGNNDSAGSQKCCSRAWLIHCRDTFRHRVVESTVFRCCVLFVIVSNAAVLASAYDGMSTAHSEFILTSNTVFSLIFGVEVMCTLIATPPREYIRDALNIFDFLVTVVSLVEIAQSDSSQYSVFRCVRMFRLLTAYPKLRETLRIIVGALGQSVWLLVLLLGVAFLLALLGVQMFSGKLCEFDHTSAWRVNTSVCNNVPRGNFDNIGFAFQTVFVTMAGDAWRSKMTLGDQAIGSASSIYFCLIHFIGGFLLLNLFIAVLLNSRAHVEERLRQERTEKDLIKELFVEAARRVKEKKKLLKKLSKLKNSGEERREEEEGQGQEMKTALLLEEEEGEDEEGHGKAGEQQSQEENPQRKDGGQENKEKEEAPSSESFLKVQRIASRIVTSWPFHAIIYLAVAATLIALAYYFPLTHPYHHSEILAEVLDIVVAVVFTAEAVLKAIHLTPRKYIRSPGNAIDFLLTIISLAIIIGQQVPMRNHRSKLDWMRLSRVLRPWTIIGQNETLELVFLSLVRSVPNLGGAFVIMVVMWVIYAILGIQSFCGVFKACTMQHWGDVTYKFPNLRNATTCTDAGYMWMSLSANFDNMPNALFTLFQVMTVSNWDEIMYAATDAVDRLHAPDADQTHFLAPIYFMTYIVIMSMFMLNFVTALLLDSYNGTKRALEQRSRHRVQEQQEQLQLAKEQQKQQMNDDDNNNINNNCSGVVVVAAPPPSNSSSTVMSSSGQTNNNGNSNNSTFTLQHQYQLKQQQQLLAIKRIEKQEQQLLQQHACTPTQKEFIDMYRRLLQFVRPPLIVEYRSGPRMWLRAFVRSHHFETMCFAAALVHVAVEGGARFADQPLWWTEALFWIDFGFTLFFCAAALVKLIVYGFISYAEQRRNVVDSVINILTLLGVSIRLYYGATTNASRMLLLLRMTRLYRLLFASTGTMLIFQTLHNSRRSILSVVVIVLLALFSYTVVGMRMFGRVKYESGRNGIWRYANFNSFDRAMFTLLRVGTADNWPPIMWGCAQQPPFCDERLGECGVNRTVANIFFCSYIFLVSWIGIRFFTAIMMQEFAESEKIDRFAIQQDHVKRFRERWKRLTDVDDDVDHALMNLDALFFFLSEQIGTPFVPVDLDAWLEIIGGNSSSASNKGAAASPASPIDASGAAAAGDGEETPSELLDSSVQVRDLCKQAIRCEALHKQQRRQAEDAAHGEAREEGQQGTRDGEGGGSAFYSDATASASVCTVPVLSGRKRRALSMLATSILHQQQPHGATSSNTSGGGGHNDTAATRQRSGSAVVNGTLASGRRAQRDVDVPDAERSLLGEQYNTAPQQDHREHQKKQRSSSSLYGNGLNNESDHHLYSDDDDDDVSDADNYIEDESVRMQVRAERQRKQRQSVLLANVTVAKSVGQQRQEEKAKQQQQQQLQDETQQRHGAGAATGLLGAFASDFIDKVLPFWSRINGDSSAAARRSAEAVRLSHRATLCFVHKALSSVPLLYNRQTNQLVVLQRTVFDAMIRFWYGVALPPLHDRELGAALAKRFRDKQILRAMGEKIVAISWKRFLQCSYSSPPAAAVGTTAHEQESLHGDLFCFSSIDSKCHVRLSLSVIAATTSASSSSSDKKAKTATAPNDNKPLVSPLASPSLHSETPMSAPNLEPPFGVAPSLSGAYSSPSGVYSDAMSSDDDEDNDSADDLVAEGSSSFSPSQKEKRKKQARKRAPPVALLRLGHIVAAIRMQAAIRGFLVRTRRKQTK